ncbi:hypothetical protein AB0B78_23595 [Streptomyces sp. NPDC040724]|uniref:hypothetical protein n=1 Tax=Streptomyces sp. NPDC040724 TaxID=3155612 RepID=UPI0033C7EDC3
MTPLFRTPRFLMLAASTAVITGAVLVPTSAFASVPAAAPHAVVADDRVVAPDDQGGSDNSGKYLLIGRAEESLFGSRQGDAGTESGIRIVPPRSRTWVCVAAPCDDPLAKPVPKDVPVPDGFPVPDGLPIPDLPVPDLPIPDDEVTTGDLTAPNG